MSRSAPHPQRHDGTADEHRPAVHSEPSPVKSAERTIRILETLAASPVRMTLAELQEASDYPRSSLHALLRTLRELRWIETDASGSRYGIGPHALLAGTAYLDRDPALPHANRELERLRTSIGHTVHFARRDAENVIYLASRESDVAVRQIYRVGRKLPTHVTALGQALLAELTEAEVEAVLPQRLAGLTPHSITDRAALHAELAVVRARGFAYEREQGTQGVACVAAVVPYRIPATDAMSCSMPLEGTQDPAAVASIAATLMAHTHSLAATLRHAGIR